jgi:hypothetical protein
LIDLHVWRPLERGNFRELFARVEPGDGFRSRATGCALYPVCQGRRGRIEPLPLHFPQSGSDHSLRQPDSLPDFVELARGLQQVELGLLALKIGVEVEHPFFIFCEAGALDVAQVDFALVQLRLQNGHILLG